MITAQTIQGVKVYSIGPVLFHKKWAVKASITDNEVICVIIFNTETYDSIIKYFSNELQAHDFIHDYVA